MSLFRKNSDDEKEEVRRKSNNSNIIMGVVCAYIIYLGVDILKNFAEGKGGNTPVWAQILGGIFFIAIGTGFLVFYLRTYFRNKSAENEQEQEDDKVMDEIEEKETAAEAEKNSPEEEEGKTDKTEGK